MNILSSIRSKSVVPTRTARQSTRQTGQSTVEIALTLPLLLLVLFGIVLSVFTFYAFIQVSNAAREGARAGSLYRLTRVEPLLNGSTKTWTLGETVQKAIYDSSVNPPLSALGTLPVSAGSFSVVSDVGIAYSGDPTDPQSGDIVTVTVNYRYTMPVVSTALPMFPQPLNIVRSVVMEVQ